MHWIVLSMARMKEVAADWLAQITHYIGHNPSFLVNGFIKAVITGALDGLDPEGKDVTEDEIDEDTSIDDTSESGMEVVQ